MTRQIKKVNADDLTGESKECIRIIFLDRSLCRMAPASASASAFAAGNALQD